MAAVTTVSIHPEEATLKSEEPYFDPDFGYGTRITWTGSKHACEAKLGEAALLGWRAQVSKVTSGSWQCVVQMPQLADEVVPDRWELDTEWAQVSIWQHPEAIADMQLHKSGAADYKKQIEDAVSHGDPVPSIGTNLVGGIKVSRWIYEALVNGEDAREVKRIVLRRRRNRPIDFATPVVLSAFETVYYTNTLAGLLDIPQTIYNQLPADPPAPAGHAWAWKARTDTSEFIQWSNRVEEQKDFVFFAWSLFFYAFE